MYIYKPLAVLNGKSVSINGEGHMITAVRVKGQHMIVILSCLSWGCT